MILQEFREFVNKGNALDLAVGVVIGAAFGKIVDSVVNDLIMPVLGVITGGVDFSARFLVLSSNAGVFDTLADARASGAPVLAYGSFINTVVQFLLIAFSIFLVMRQINRMRGPAPATK
jgi:large conductance mechanosensitive channel